RRLAPSSRARRPRRFRPSLPRRAYGRHGTVFPQGPARLLPRFPSSCFLRRTGARWTAQLPMIIVRRGRRFRQNAASLAALYARGNEKFRLFFPHVLGRSVFRLVRLERRRLARDAFPFSLERLAIEAEHPRRSALVAVR